MKVHSARLSSCLSHHVGSQMLRNVKLGCGVIKSNTDGTIRYLSSTVKHHRCHQKQLHYLHIAVALSLVLFTYWPVTIWKIHVHTPFPQLTVCQEDFHLTQHGFLHTEWCHVTFRSQPGESCRLHLEKMGNLSPITGMHDKCCVCHEPSSHQTRKGNPFSK